MTRDELIERLNDALRKVNKSDERIYAAMNEGLGSVVSSIEDAIARVEQLDSPPAMTWQAPSCECMAYVQGCGDKILHVVKIGDHWCRSRPGKTYYAPVGDALICPIPAPPALPKRGEVDLAKHCEEAAKIVATWPAWKRGVLGHSTEPMNSTPREPVDNSADCTKRGDV